MRNVVLQVVHGLDHGMGLLVQEGLDVVGLGGVAGVQQKQVRVRLPLRLDDGGRVGHAGFEEIEEFQGVTLGGNFYKADGSRWIDAYKIFEVDGVKVAVFRSALMMAAAWAMLVLFSLLEA